MNLKYKPDFERVREYWEAFWQKEVIDRPCICIQAPKPGVEEKVLNHTPVSTYMTCISEDYDIYLNEYEDWVNSIYFAGEAIPYFEVTLGPDQFAGFLGAEILAFDGYLTTWAQPVVNDWKGFNIELIDKEGSYLEKVIKFIRYAANYSKGKFLISMLDLHSNMDALSALRGPENLCYDLMDSPEEIESALNKVRSLYKPVFEKVYNAGDMKNRGSIGWAPTYCEGKFAVVQCDFSCMLSPEQARKYVIPAVQEEAAYLDHCVYHYDGKEALGHLDDILAIKEIDVIQWVPGDGQPKSFEWMELLKKIQKAKKGLWIYDWTPQEIKKYYKELRPEGVVFSLNTSSQKEAEELIKWLKLNT